MYCVLFTPYTIILRVRRENELLRQQLKKYVETVQVMRRSDGAGGEQLQEGAAEARNRSSELAPVRDYSLEVELYEQKLVQVGTSFLYSFMLEA